MTQVTLTQLARVTDGKVIGDGKTVIHSVAPMHKATIGQITFLSNPKYAKYLACCKASVIMVKEDYVTLCPSNILVVDDPYVAFARVAGVFDTTPRSAMVIAPSAVIQDDAAIGINVSIGDNAVIESGAVISDNVVIGAGCFVGRDSKVGKNSKLWANVTVHHSVTIGSNSSIHSGTVVGANGFGYANDAGEWIKIPHLGGVEIGNRVEIGACTCIDRGSLDDTVIEDNVVLDNLLQIAHNVHIGYGTAIAGGTVVAGSTSIGKHCTIGGATVINGHIEIANGVTITGMSMVMRSIPEKGVYSSGIPLQTNRKWRKTAVRVHRIHEMNGSTI